MKQHRAHLEVHSGRAIQGIAPRRRVARIETQGIPFRFGNWQRGLRDTLKYPWLSGVYRFRRLLQQIVNKQRQHRT